MKLPRPSESDALVADEAEADLCRSDADHPKMATLTFGSALLDPPPPPSSHPIAFPGISAPPPWPGQALSRYLTENPVY